MIKYIVFKETWDYIDDNYKSVSKREVCLTESKKVAMAKAKEWAEEKIAKGRFYHIGSFFGHRKHGCGTPDKQAHQTIAQV